MKIAKTIMFLAIAVFFLTGAYTLTSVARKVNAQLDQLGTEIALALQSIRSTTTLVNTYTKTALEALTDPRNAKSLQAGLDVAATAKGSLLLVNREVIPRAMRTLDDLNAALTSVNGLVIATNDQVNGHVLPQTDQALQELQKTLQTAQAATTTTVEAITATVRDPALSEALASLASASSHLDETTANIAEASKQLPEIAADIEKISKTSSKYRAAILISQIVSAIARAFF